MTTFQTDRKTIAETSPNAVGQAASTATIVGLDDWEEFTVDATLQGATGDTLDVYLQRSTDGTNFVDWLHLPQLAAAAATIRHTIHSEDFEAGATTVGADTTPVLAAGSFTVPHPGQSVRVLFDAGATTSAGALQTIVLTKRRKR